MKAEAVDPHLSHPQSRSSAAYFEAQIHRRSTNDATLESLVRELLRPLLKDWLDRNVAGIVERCVNAEIERIAKA
jgi:uncharacterized protein